jgi:hypothetical protein
MSAFKYYQSFLNTINSSERIDSDLIKKMRDSQFRKHLSQFHPDLALVEETAQTMKHVIAKPQKLLVDHEDYYVAIDLALNTYYICYRELLMLDLDSYKDEINLDECLPHCLCQVVPSEGETIDLEQKRQKLWKRRSCKDGTACQLRYRIFKSRKGYHAFVVSHKFDPKSGTAVGLMAESSTDFFYIIFSYLRGWSVRLNRKPGEKIDEPLYTYMFDWFLGKTYELEFDMTTHRILDSCPGKVLPELTVLIDTHLLLCEIFNKESECVTLNL